MPWRGPSGGHVHALDTLEEHDLAVQRAVDRALRGDHPEALDLLLGQVIGQTHDQLEFGRASPLCGAVLDLDLDPTDVPALARGVHLHRDRRTGCEADREKLLRVRPGVLPPGIEWLIYGHLMIAHLHGMPERVAFTPRGGFHPCQPVRSHLAPFCRSSFQWYCGRSYERGLKSSPVSSLGKK